MAIQSNFPSLKPSLLLDFANTKQLDPRISFSRASTATFYNGVTTAMAEQNLFTYSQEFDNAVWTYTNATLTANTTTAPDGTSTADSLIETATTGEHRLFRAFQYVGDFVSPFTVSVFVKANTRSIAYLFNGSGSAGAVFFNLSTGTIGSNTYPSNITNAVITSAGNGWYRISALFTNGGGGGRQISFGLSSTDGVISYAGDGTSSIYGWGFQLEQRSAVTAYTATTTQAITNYIPVLQTAASGVARFDNNPTTGESLGLLIEESRTNLILRSDDFATTWQVTRATISSNATIAPDGTLTADKLVDDTSANSHYVYQSATVSNATLYTTTVYAKAGERGWMTILVGGSTASSNTFFDLVNGALGSVSANATASITSVGNGWYRCSLSVTSSATTVTTYIGTATANNTNTAAGNGFSGLFLWGAQLEAGAFATSYIPTVASQVTRAADAASMTGTNFSSWFNNAEGTVFLTYRKNVGTSGRLAVFESNSLTVSTNGINIDLTSATNARTEGFANGANYWVLNQTVAQQSVQNLVLGYKTNDIGFSANAATPTTDTTALMASTGITALAIGSRIDGSASLNGYLNKIAYYPIRLSNTNLQALTS